MSDRSDGSWANHRMPNDPRSGTNVDDCEIGVWDPNSVNKSYPANNSSQYHMPSSNAWASSEQSNPNYSYGNYNNHQDYTSQLTSQAQNLSINAVSSQNSNLYYSGEPPVPQAAPYVQQRQEPMPTLTNTAPSRHENHSRRSDSTNWRNPIPSYNLPQESSSYNAPYSADAQYQQQRSQYSNQAPSQNWSSFQNPLLSGNNDEDEESPEAIVERMKQSKAAAELAAEELLRRPTSIAKSALAQLQKDLKDAAKPFESAKSLQECRNKHLGIENKSAGNDVVKAETTRKSDLPEDSAIPALVSKSNLSASAKAFVPSSPSIPVQESPSQSFVKTSTPVRKRQTRPPEIPKLDLQISPDTARAYIKPKKVDSRYAESENAGNKSFEVGSQTESLGCSSDLVTPDLNVFFEADVCWNPLNGPTPVKKCSKKRKSWSQTKDHNLSSDTNQQNEFSIDSLSKSFVNEANSFSMTGIKEVNADGKSGYDESNLADEENLSSLHYHYSCVDDYYQSLSMQQEAILMHPVLGLYPLCEIGCGTDDQCMNLVRQKVKLKATHSTNSADASDQNKEAALDLVGKCVYELASNPASFDHLVHDDLVPKLHNFKLDDTSITEIVDMVYEACVMEQNFRYLGGQLCHVLSRSQDGLPGFRSTLLGKAQKEFGNMDEALNGSKEQIERALGFTQFMSEIFLSLLLQKPDKSLTRFDVLGRAILGVVEKLIKHSDSDECVQCAVRVLKLTAISLEDSLKDDGKNSMAKLDAILASLANIFTNNPMEKETKLNPTTKFLLSGLLKLKDQHWGRVTHEEPYPPTEEPSFSSYYYPDASQYPNQAFQNEPVYFTPQGVQYTAADVFDDDFYNTHLENQNAAFDNQQQHNHSSYDDSNQYADGSSSGGLNPPNYATWSAADADYYDDNCTEDDYDNELENFLRQV